MRYSLTIYRGKGKDFHAIEIDNVTEDEAMSILGAFHFTYRKTYLSGEREYVDVNDLAAYLKPEKE